jgi:hypothetical protein
MRRAGGGGRLSSWGKLWEGLERSKAVMGHCSPVGVRHVAIVGRWALQAEAKYTDEPKGAQQHARARAQARDRAGDNPP